jgi:hypothetical protein
MTSTRRYVTRDRVYFSYMGATWSCCFHTLSVLFLKVERDEPFDLDDYLDIRPVKKAPTGASVEPLIGRRFLNTPAT